LGGGVFTGNAGDIKEIVVSDSCAFVKQAARSFVCCVKKEDIYTVESCLKSLTREE
jgi:hypothetical protein